MINRKLSLNVGSFVIFLDSPVEHLIDEICSILATLHNCFHKFMYLIGLQ